MRIMLMKNLFSLIIRSFLEKRCGMHISSIVVWGKKLKPNDTSEEAFYIQNSNLQPE